MGSQPGTALACAAIATVLASGAAAAPGGAPAPQVPVAASPGLAAAPAGWSYLAELAPYGPADIFHVVSPASGDGPKTQMRAETRHNVGILVREVDAPLTPATALSWRWNVERLPAKAAETTAATHDYLSIAVKFENGQDLTYMWSAALPPETGFHCPLPTWKDRETHVVVRSGGQDLGKWLAERRPVLADYARYIGGKPPGRIVQVWLIANSLIEQTDGAASFGDIAIDPGASAAPVRVF